jgi:hypothetical protein
MQGRQPRRSQPKRALMMLLAAAVLAVAVGSAPADAAPPEDSNGWTRLAGGTLLCSDGVSTFSWEYYTLGNVPEVFFGKPPTPPQPPNPPPLVRYIDRFDLSNGCTVPTALTFHLSDGSVISGAILPGTDRSVRIQELEALGVRFKLTELASLGFGSSAVAPYDFVIGP